MGGAISCVIFGISKSSFPEFYSAVVVFGEHETFMSRIDVLYILGQSVSFQNPRDRPTDLSNLRSQLTTQEKTVLL